ncbi:hypothetical protein DK080_26320 [Salmonella enterica subsp. enterica serovar Poona]|nr:hypothetical protein [Salmonella enterica subsp. enterica serovar Poona]EGS7664969.1 hypothetical protein [Salmonella enterica]ECA2558611.1 hypothetical protein [Salmonella enterica subsp. enterica serovar Poona]ECD3889043.1 hypothetical protein [Salmonella enterica subsp. enterica serovar Poona]EDP9162580.1 hypothetical protein [Salmonella enterica subsp. enterica serovar Poona]
MRMNHMSLNRKWILFSLVLLSPAILAAENLNFNYTRSDISGLDSRLALQARACHSLGDPMDIRVRFNNVMMTSEGSPGLMAKIAITGFPYPKSSTVFASATLQHVPAPGGLPGTDPDLQNEWGVYVQGSASGTMGSLTTGNPASEQTIFQNPFCFDRRVANPAFEVSKFLIPIYKFRSDPYGNPNPYYKDGYWDKYCKNKPDSADLNWYWPDYYHPPVTNYGNSSIQENISRVESEGGGSIFLSSHIFFGGKYTINGSLDKPVFVGEGGFDNTLKTETDISSNFSYTFPPTAGNTSSTYPYSTFIVDKGEFIVRASTRQITSITLTLFDGKTGEESVFEWNRNLHSGGYASDNNLFYNTKVPKILPVTARVFNKQDEKNDPYANFYNNPGYFRGTLVAKGELNQEYQTYIDTKSPLSLPPDAQGTINLVNTDSLTFTIDQMSGGGKYFVTLSGQPLKFGPVYTDLNKEALSAMKVRNACY